MREPSRPGTAALGLEWLSGHVFKVPWAFYRLATIAHRDLTGSLAQFLSYSLSYS